MDSIGGMLNPIGKNAQNTIENVMGLMEIVLVLMDTIMVSTGK